MHDVCDPRNLASSTNSTPLTALPSVPHSGDSLGVQPHNDETQKPRFSDVERQASLTKEYDSDSSRITDGSSPASLDAVKSAGPPPGWDPASFPDGGLQAWLTATGGFCCLFVSFGWINCIGVFQEYYQTHQLRGLSPSTISWVLSLETFMMFFCGPFVGKILDSFGPRWVLLVGSFLHVFGLMMASISTEYYQLILSQGICSAIGAACIFYPALSTTSSWFFHRRAFALGVVTAGSSLGGVVFPLMILHLVNTVGFGWAMRSAAFLILGLLVIANITLRSRLPPTKSPLILTEFVRPLQEPAFSLICTGAFFFFLGMFLPLNFILLEARRAGVPKNIVNGLIPILNAVGLVGRIVMGWTGDRVGRINVQITLCLATALFVVALWIPARLSTAGIIVFAALYGFTTSAIVSMGPAIIAQISPDVRKIGVRNGTFFAIISVAALIGNPIGGALLKNEHGQFWEMMVFTGVMQLVGAGFYLGGRLVLTGSKARAKV